MPPAVSSWVITSKYALPPAVTMPEPLGDRRRQRRQPFRHVGLPSPPGPIPRPRQAHATGARHLFRYSRNRVTALPGASGYLLFHRSVTDSILLVAICAIAG